MNLLAARALPVQPEVGTWYRAFDPKFLPSAIRTEHSAKRRSRFNAPDSAAALFEILYLAENHLVALLEAQAMFGSPLIPGELVPHPNRSWVVINVQVRLEAIANLTDVVLAQSPLATSAQELTGDWRGYAQRSPATRIQQPTRLAPTQLLDAALFQSARFEGFRTLSAKLPYHEVLAIFPQRLQAGSYVRYTYMDSSGRQQTYSIP